MEKLNRKNHWETIYTTKELKDTSWYQPIPTTSLDFLTTFTIKKDAKIIDIGGGDSFFVDHLLKLGYTDISVLDISEASLDRAKIRLGEDASKVKWIVTDVANFEPSEKYDFWHDRAAFHFLTDENEVDKYISMVHKHLHSSGILIIGTFSEEGPTKCSGIEIQQYSEASMVEKFSRYFEKVHCDKVDHATPFDTIQKFIFCSFRKREI